MVGRGVRGIKGSLRVVHNPPEGAETGANQPVDGKGYFPP
jgi:hypothetical protein